MIKLQNINKSFGQKKVLTDISFKTKEGEIIGFLGPNGAGKTTTMRVIVGYLKPTSGEIIVDDKNPIEDRVEVLKLIGYLAENNPLYQEMRVLEYLNFIRTIKNDSEENLNLLIKKTGVEDVLQSRIEELSRGYKQRVGLTSSLLGDSKILILDEPTSGLDPIEQDKIRQLIKDLRHKKTIILSTHILSEVEDVATRLIIINKGKIAYDGIKPKRKGDVEKLFKKLVK